MSRFFKRWLAYFLIPAGVILLSLPLMADSSPMDYSLDSESVQIQDTSLKNGCRIVGGISLVLGVFALIGLYSAQPKGIQIGKPMAIMTWDLVVLLVGFVFTWWFLDLTLHFLFDTRPYWGEDLTNGMGLFWVVMVNPVMALITTATSVQTFNADENGIMVDGLFGQRTVEWSEIKEIILSEIAAPRTSRTAISVRTVTKTLKFHGDFFPVTIMEPPLESTKSKILHVINEHAPDRFQADLETISSEWTKW